MSLNKCIHHDDRVAEYVCDVCQRYFCEECVSERFYPKPGWICHECSGVKPAEPAPKPVPAPQVRSDSDAQPTDAAARSGATPRIALSIEIAVIALCVLFIAGRAAYLLYPREEVLELASSAPDDLAEFCIGKLTLFESGGAYPSLADLATACPAPIEIQETELGHLVVSPDPDRFGFSEIELEREPFSLMIME